MISKTCECVHKIDMQRANMIHIHREIHSKLKWNCIQCYISCDWENKNNDMENKSNHYRLNSIDISNAIFYGKNRIDICVCVRMFLFVYAYACFYFFSCSWYNNIVLIHLLMLSDCVYWAQIEFTWFHDIINVKTLFI